MWILDSNGDFLQGKRVWLRPGKRYLFGRVKKDGVFRALDHKGVSRRQCVIEVGVVNPGDGSRPHTRSRLTVVDENSKGGTQVDGHMLKGTSQELTELEHQLRLGSYPHLLTLKWEPVCLSFFLTSKEKKADDPLAPKRTLLEPLDVKAVLPFMSKQTTHVVATKRNTVPGLQALITGKHIVDPSYIDALVFAATPDDLEEDENLSPLERDFDTAWPDPQQHIPPKGREPTSKPVRAYAPDAMREHVFEDWVFVFLESTQYETILPAISTGRGKGLLYQLEQGKTTVKEVVTFMRNAANGKNFGNFDPSTNSGGVVLVKPMLKGDTVGSGNALVDEVDSTLNQRCIDQADFLDAILASDAASLRRPIRSENSNQGATDSISAQIQGSPIYADNQVNGNQDNHEPTDGESAEYTAPPRKRPRTRAAPISRFKTFDDEFDMDTVALYEPLEDGSDPQALPRSDAKAATNSPANGQSRSERQDVTTPKKGTPSTDDTTVTGFLPGAAALKRRRPDFDRGSGRSGDCVEQSRDGAGCLKKTQSAKAEKRVDIRQAARERREVEEETARQEQEGLAVQYMDLSVDEMKNLAVVEEMEMPARGDGAARGLENSSERWDERWNGRKNFKKFRRAGEGTGAVNGQTRKVLVPLVEVKRKNYGIGEAYWSSSGCNQEAEDRGASSSASRPTNASSQSQRQPQAASSAEDPITSPMTGPQEDPADLVRTINGNRRGQARSGDTSEQSQQTMNSSRQGGKRPPSSAGPARATKKQRLIQTRAASESESDEELRFKFRSRRRE